MVKASLNSYNGKITVLGTNEIKKEGICYNYIRMEGSDGEEIYLKDIIIPNRLDSYINGVGSEVIFHTVELENGDKKMMIVYGLKTNGKTIDGIDEVRSALMKLNKHATFMAIALFMMGVPMLLFFFLGIIPILIGIKALRSKLEVPEKSVMEQAMA